ncbi:hypothetical protein Ahy_B10g104372 [Arachis hypogaea]|uniref:Uncharacterized protein n=1 Tax=Arachis hypogaea TaxID=3818 RepID=A0A444X5D3_ARAHY|nr:hypothetical protein Ahy_B10g104372 [Arachis hypogaea]
MCTMEKILQDHVKLDSDTITNDIRPLVEAKTSINVKSIIAEVQSRFNYTVERLPCYQVLACCPNQRLDWRDMNEQKRLPIGY